MKQHVAASLSALVLLMTAISPGAGAQDAEDWITVFDGSNLDGFILTGDANWHKVGDVVEVTEGNGYLVVIGTLCGFSC